MIGKIKCSCGCGMDIQQSLKNYVFLIESDMTTMTGQKCELDVTSGARCDKYNATIQGSIAGDAHTRGLALDVFVDTSTPKGRMKAGALLSALGNHGIKRFGDGIANHNYLHFDIADDLPTPRLWIYK